MNSSINRGGEEPGKKNKSEEFREMLKAARGFGKSETTPTAQKKPTTKRDAFDDKENEKIREQPQEQQQQQEQEEEKDDNGRKFTFLKRKSRNPQFQKVSRAFYRLIIDLIMQLNWKNVPKRVNCWGKKEADENGRSSSPKQRERLPSPRQAGPVSRGRQASTSQEKCKT